VDNGDALGPPPSQGQGQGQGLLLDRAASMTDLLLEHSAAAAAAAAAPFSSPPREQQQQQQRDLLGPGVAAAPGGACSRSPPQRPTPAPSPDPDPTPASHRTRRGAQLRAAAAAAAAATPGSGRAQASGLARALGPALLAARDAWEGPPRAQSLGSLFDAIACQSNDENCPSPNNLFAGFLGARGAAAPPGSASKPPPGQGAATPSGAGARPAPADTPSRGAEQEEGGAPRQRRPLGELPATGAPGRAPGGSGASPSRSLHAFSSEDQSTSSFSGLGGRAEQPGRGRPGAGARPQQQQAAAAAAAAAAAGATTPAKRQPPGSPAPLGSSAAKRARQLPLADAWASPADEESRPF
jgi:hypothetical protein